jgi:hypothetical protein
METHPYERYLSGARRAEDQQPDPERECKGSDQK